MMNNKEMWQIDITNNTVGTTGNEDNWTIWKKRLKDQKKLEEDSKLADKLKINSSVTMLWKKIQVREK